MQKYFTLIFTDKIGYGLSKRSAELHQKNLKET